MSIGSPYVALLASLRTQLSASTSSTTVQYCTVQYCTVQYCTVLYSICHSQLDYESNCKPTHPPTRTTTHLSRRIKTDRQDDERRVSTSCFGGIPSASTPCRHTEPLRTSRSHRGIPWVSQAEFRNTPCIYCFARFSQPVAHALSGVGIDAFCSGFGDVPCRII